MELFSALLIPLILALTALWGMAKRTDVYDALTVGAGEGLKTAASLFPALLILMVSIYLLRQSGALDLISQFCAPVLHFFGIPPELAPLMLIRPISGSGALGLGAELIAQYGPDSLIGRTAAVMLGSTETTFYTISVYFGGLNIRRTRYAIPAALIADLTGFIAAACSVRFFF